MQLMETENYLGIIQTSFYSSNRKLIIMLLGKQAHRNRSCQSFKFLPSPRAGHGDLSLFMLHLTVGEYSCSFPEALCSMACSLLALRWPWYFQVYEVLDLWPLPHLLLVLDIDPAWGLVTNKCSVGHCKVCGDRLSLHVPSGYLDSSRQLNQLQLQKREWVK